jgi:hypothetical protein
LAVGGWQRGLQPDKSPNWFGKGRHRNDPLSHSDVVAFGAVHHRQCASAAVAAERALLWNRRADRAGLDRPERLWRAKRGVSWKVYAFGTVGLFGYHFLYFTAFRMCAHFAETGLIAYLWPLFIVLLLGFLPGERLRPLHVMGALIAFAGAALIVLGRGGRGGGRRCPGAVAGLSLRADLGGIFGAVARLGAVPTESVTVYCLATAALSACWRIWRWSRPSGPRARLGWLAVSGAGDWPGWRGVLHLGYRDEERRHPAFGCRLLCCALAVDAGAGSAAGIAKPTWTICLGGGADYRRRWPRGPARKG